MYELTVQTTFSAAHHLLDYSGACRRIHGHNWKVKASLQASQLNEKGMVFDLMEFQRILNTCVQQFDHRMINEVPPFDRINPTSEHLARIIFEWMSEHLPANLRLTEIRVAETDDYSVVYTPE
ncbi:MAG TPA: 6-carboxytetrahydropterin synthase QueD [bacterium]|mgnify:CR=1 FL=1|nr:6-carboxytetrahydropterin synthase QueD [bacterium]HNT65200.1 6-carboxytetrahydropterin synthase QueD [bacterium]HOX86997.1 6-carboxytetrahydropterin synthase QueD [bacterium]HPG46328.1 6-carboxytetrahydropterin synthase QueD [bacterium]HPM98478.1 6-carboxytetrahydropterin synthase QueD [bacterium]